MAKKKKEVAEEDLKTELDDFDDDEEIVEEIYPKISKKPPKEENQEVLSTESFSEIPEEEMAEESELELEEVPEIPEYKYLDLELRKGALENDYELFIKGQSHDFCNILVKHLLTIKGVNMAAYKFTRLEPAKIFIRLESNYKIIDILHKGIESLRAEVTEIQKSFLKQF